MTCPFLCLADDVLEPGPERARGEGGGEGRGTSRFPGGPKAGVLCENAARLWGPAPASDDGDDHESLRASELQGRQAPGVKRAIK